MSSSSSPSSSSFSTKKNLSIEGMDISPLENLSTTKEEDRLMTLSVGPQHPGSGHFRFTIKIDGDYIVYCDPDPGYVHRGEEKMCEYRSVLQNIPHLERPVIHDSANITYSYSLAIEDLFNIQVPRRGGFIRAITSELDRINYTLY